ncbi:MAG: SDR family oxidoreductase [Armatimonadetes bacterium]|nr:SDR family oxidoreductase [Armatimonadota bacterium]
MPSLDGKVAVVTGASRGIGRAIALRLAAEGARVVLSARDQDALHAAVGEIAQAGGAADAIALDLRESEAAGELAQFAQERFGAIDIVVNNAGATKRGEFLALPDEDWADGFALKFFGAVRLTRAAWPALTDSHGSVLNIAGVGGRTPGAEFSIGGSVNAALLALTKSLADVGIRDGVQVNAINPGPVRTDRLTRRLAALGTDVAAEAQFVRVAQITRIGEPADIAGLAAFIVGPAGRWLQGALIDMDGGQTKTL